MISILSGNAFDRRLASGGVYVQRVLNSSLPISELHTVYDPAHLLPLPCSSRKISTCNYKTHHAQRTPTPECKRLFDIHIVHLQS